MFKIFIISIFMYIYLTVLLRLFGKKEFSQLNVFDFVVFLVISEITTMSLETQDLSVLDSVIATLTLIILDRIESFITMRSKKLRDFFEGRPCYIIYRGKIQYQNMKKLRYSIDDLCHHLRVSDIDSVSKVDFAILETNGSLSVIPKQEIPSALLGFLFAQLFSSILPFALSFAAGAMMFVCIEELIPEANALKEVDVGTMSFMVGFMIMMMLDIMFG